MSFEALIKQKCRITNPMIRICLAEFFGTFILCLVGNGAVHEGAYKETGIFAVCFAYGLAVAFGIYASAGVSGGHVNPAVTIAMATLGRLGKTAGENAVMFALYSISQILGAFLSCFFVYGAYKAEEEYLTSQKNLSTHDLTGFYATWPTGDFEISPANLFFDQVIGTWILITVIFSVTDKRNANPGGAAPLLIGLAACTIGLSYGANGGGAINPARDLGPRLFSLIMFGSEALHGSAHFFWIPLVAPLVGGVIGALCYLFVISAHWPEEETKIEEEYEKVSDGEKL